MEYSEALDLIKQRLSANRYRHSLRVADTALILARRYAEDESWAYLAGILHDYARDLPPEQILSIAGRYDLIKLEDYEIELNHRIADILKAQGLSLRDKDSWPLFFERLLSIFQSETKELPSFLLSCPKVERFTIKRQIYFQEEWRL
jgi:HD superfamily phosphodiesterase